MALVHPESSGAHDDASGVRSAPRVRVSASSRERPAWNEMVATVRAQVRSLVGPSRDVDDLTQAALEQLLHAIDGFEGRCELSTFTYRIASRVVLNHWRSLRRYFRRFVLSFETLPDVADADEAGHVSYDERRRAARLHYHLDALSADHRIVVTLADLEDMPASRIAEILECPEPTVRSRLKRGRAELARRLVRDPLFSDEGGAS